jgi:hypothetical protein
MDDAVFINEALVTGMQETIYIVRLLRRFLII